MFSFQYEMFDDIKARSVLYDKKKKIGYLLTQKDKGKAHIFKLSMAYSAAISFIVGYFLHLPFYAYIVMAVLLYGLCLLYFNKKFLPSLTMLKKVEKKKEVKKQKEGQFPVVGLGYAAIGIGLIYCLFTNQVEAGMMVYVVYGAIAICFINAFFFFYNYVKKV